MVEISGTTEIIAHLGVPTHAFKAPLIYNPWFQDRGIDAVVVPMGCEAADFPDFLRLVFRLRNIRGALITMPHKVSVVGLLDEASRRVRVSGACNAVRRDAEGRLTGDMFDGEGFLRGVVRKGRRVEGASALIVGSGGVGSAIAASLADAGAARLGLADSRTAVAEALAGRLSAEFPALEVQVVPPDPAGFEIVVNATPLGMNDGDPLPMDVAGIEPGAFVGEVVMKRRDTAFVAAARARGCDTQIGLDMLFEQIPAYLEFFGLPSTTPERLAELARLKD